MKQTSKTLKLRKAENVAQCWSMHACARSWVKISVLFYDKTHTNQIKPEGFQEVDRRQSLLVTAKLHPSYLSYQAPKDPPVCTVPERCTAGRPPQYARKL